jgi:pimeloyl-ACP methyl ester carboxylesterase
MDGLVLMSPFYCAPGHSPGWDDIDHYARDVHARFIDALRIRLGEGHDRDDILNAMAAKLTQRVLPDGVMALFQLYLGSRSWALKSLGTPATIVLGDREGPMVTRGAQALADALPAAVLHILPDCGHYPMHERPASLNRLLERVIDVPPGHCLSCPPSAAAHRPPQGSS